MEKLSFFSSVGKSFELYFQNFWSFLTPFLWPILWMWGGALIMIVPLFIQSFTGIGSMMPIVAVTSIVGAIIYILAIVRLITLDPATAIVIKKLLYNGEEPDYKAALQEAESQKSKLAKTFLWSCFSSGILSFIVSIIPAIILGICFPASRLTNDLICRFIVSFTVAPLFIFVFQFFALRKDLCARECVLHSRKLVWKHFLPIATIFFVVNGICFLGGALIISFARILLLVVIPIAVILHPVVHILKNYWYLRFMEEENGEV